MRPNRIEQVLVMVDSLLMHCDSLEVAACRNIGRNETVLIKKWDQKLIGWFGYENANNFANIWIRPSPDLPHPWLFLDDIPLSLALNLNKKYQCILVETSQGNCQIRLLASESLSKEQRKVVQVELVKLLGSNADFGSTAGCKWGRLPGFRNRKPNRDCWTNLLSLPDENLPMFDPTPYLKVEFSTTQVVVRVSALNSKNNIGDFDQSGKDFGYIFNRLRFLKEHGHDFHEEAKRLKAELRERTQKRDPQLYAERTINAALKFLG